MAFTPYMADPASLDEVVWHQYQPGVTCAKIPVDRNQDVSEVLLRNSPSESNPPWAMVFYSADLTTERSSSILCSEANISLFIKWYPYPNSLQTHILADTSITHFSEILVDDPLWNAVDNLADGDVRTVDFSGRPRVKVLKNKVQLEFPDYLAPETPVRGDDWADNDVLSQVAESITTMEEEDLDDLSAAAEERIFDTELPQQEANPFQEMFDFEKDFPAVYETIIVHFIEYRQRLLSQGVYIPIPPGLVARYSYEELENMGLTQDPDREAAAWSRLTELRRTVPGFDESTPFEFKLFEGREPGLFYQLVPMEFNGGLNAFGEPRRGLMAGPESQTRVPNPQDLAQGIPSMPQPQPQPQQQPESHLVGAPPGYLNESEEDAPRRNNLGQYATSVSTSEESNSPPLRSMQGGQRAPLDKEIPADYSFSAYSLTKPPISKEQENEECLIHDECLTDIEEEEYHPEKEGD
ncbi:hypothetical protein AA313_de0202889 [Arthrobotrys entomopaga]|nr:hypothetical protein AA313_de0202889 [Arthrobotrys entomopaga]